MSVEDKVREIFVRSAEVIQLTADKLTPQIAEAATMIVDAYKAGRGVFIFGNGGSASDAQHIAGELVGRFLVNRPALKAESLSTDTSVITCIANDYSYEEIFSRQLEGKAVAGDVAIGLSTSGNSPNVVAALTAGRKIGMKTIAMTGPGGGKCAPLADVLLDVPCEGSTPRVQEAHVVTYHVLCELVEAEVVAQGVGRPE